MLQSSSFAALFPGFSRSTPATDFDGAGVLQSFAAGVPRLLPGSGVLIEQAAANSIRNPRGEYASAPTFPTTTRPTNWGSFNSNGGAYSIIGQGTENGLPYIDVSYSGVSTGSGNLSELYPETSAAVAAVAGQTWTFSVYVRLLSGSMPAGANVSIGINENTSAGAFITGAGTAAGAMIPNATAQRFAYTRLLTSGSTAQILTRLTISNTGAGTDLTGLVLRWYAPQLERNEFASSVILPPVGVPAGTTRAVDVLTFDGSRFAAAFTMAQRTNLLLRSQEIDNNSVWSRPSGVIPDTVSPDTQAAPDGTTTADTYNSPTAGVTGTLYQIFPVTPGVVYTFSWYVKLGTLAAADYRYAIRDDTAGAFIVSDVAVAGVTSAGWTRATATFTAPAGCYLARVYLYRYTPATAGTVHLWGAQVEVGSVASTYIATTTAAVTRTGSEVGWAVISVTIPQTLGPSISQGIIELSDGTTSRFLVRSSPGGATINAFYVRSNVGSGAFGLGSMTPGAAFRVAMAWAADGTTRFVGPSGAVVTIAAGGNQPIGGFVTIKLGLEGTGTALNGRLHRFYCGHVAPTDAQLIAAQATSADVRSIMRS